jgi:hypothetical protein
MSLNLSLMLKNYSKAILISLILGVVGALGLWSCTDNSVYVQGERLYGYHCASCHMDDGSGLKAIIPNIQQTDYLGAKLDSLPCLIRHGKAGYTVEDSILVEMPPNYKLTEFEVNNLINFLLKNWTDKDTLYTVTHTADLLDQCPVPKYRFGN